MDEKNNSNEIHIAKLLDCSEELWMRSPKTSLLLTQHNLIIQNRLKKTIIPLNKIDSYEIKKYFGVFKILFMYFLVFIIYISFLTKLPSWEETSFFYKPTIIVPYLITLGVLLFPFLANYMRDLIFITSSGKKIKLTCNEKNSDREYFFNMLDTHISGKLDKEVEIIE